jgi:TolA-binding protein
MAATTTMMQQLLQEFAENLGNTFDGIHQQLVNLNTRLHDLEQGRIRGEAVASIHTSLDREAAIDDLTTETKNVMVAAGRSFLKSKLEEPQSSTATQVINEVADNLLPAPADPSSQGQFPVSASAAPTMTPPALQPLPLSCPLPFGQHPANPVAAQPTTTAERLQQPAIWLPAQQVPPLLLQQPAPLAPLSIPTEDPI